MNMYQTLLKVQSLTKLMNDVCICFSEYNPLMGDMSSSGPSRRVARKTTGGG